MCFKTRWRVTNWIVDREKLEKKNFPADVRCEKITHEIIINPTNHKHFSHITNISNTPGLPLSPDARHDEVVRQITKFVSRHYLPKLHQIFKRGICCLHHHLFLFTVSDTVFIVFGRWTVFGTLCHMNKFDRNLLTSSTLIVCKLVSANKHK